MIAEKAIARMIVFACQGRAEKAREYLGTMLPRSTPCSLIREVLRDNGLTDEALEFLTRVLPWLEDETLGAPAGSQAVDPAAALREAGKAGRPRSDFDPRALDRMADEIAEFDLPTGGRPRKMVRLREYDSRFNPFAMP